MLDIWTYLKTFSKDRDQSAEGSSFISWENHVIIHETAKVGISINFSFSYIFGCSDQIIFIINFKAGITPSSNEGLK